MTIERPQSLVNQVREILRQRIRDRVYPPGGRLPSESELARELGVSRATVRTVLTRFAAEGLILRKQGDGTYVNERIREVDSRYGGLWDFSRLIQAGGYAATIEPLQVTRRAPAPAERTALQVAEDGEVVALIRLFLADDRPVIYTTNVLSAARLRVPVHQIDGQQPIHQILRRTCRLEIAYAVSDISAAEPEQVPAGALRRQVDHPLLRLEETFYSKQNEPLVHGLSYYDHAAIPLRLVQAWG